MSYDYFTPKGKNRYKTGYINIINKNGEITNSIPKEGSITNPNTGTSTPNSNPSTNPTNSPDLSSFKGDLTGIKDRLDKIDKKLNDIKQEQIAQWIYNPNIDVQSSFGKLRSELTKLDVTMQDALKFLRNLINDINNLTNDFNAAKEIFEKGIDSPNIPRGKCPFNISGPTPGSNKINVFTIDPCYYISHYKPILTIFFTIFLSYGVVMFSLKYLFNVGGK